MCFSKRIKTQESIKHYYYYYYYYYYHLFVLKIIRTVVQLFTIADKAITKYTDHSIKTSFPLH